MGMANARSDIASALRILNRTTVSRGAILACLSVTAGAANAQDADEMADAADVEEVDYAGGIVVTGTLIRGEAPVGSSLIATTATDIEESGATTANQILSEIPQVSNLFNQSPERRFGIAANQVQIARPNLRNISADNASSASTLVLFDGHRVATAGVTQASIDPDLIPAGAIERVEVVTDGGSAIYGADAVGGVINFITRKRFDGVLADVQYGMADEFYTIDANLTAGKDWGSGSAYISYNYNKGDELYGRDREFIRNYDYANDRFTGLVCPTPNITVGGTTYTGSGGALAPGTTRCNDAAFNTVIPEVERHGVFANLTQELAPWLTADVQAFFSKRTTEGRGTYGATSLAIPVSNFYYQPLPANPAGTQRASFNFAPALGDDNVLNGSDISEWGVSAEFTADLTTDWQLRTLFNYSESDSSSFVNGPNQARLNAAGAGTTAATAINPYDVDQTDPALLASILNNRTFDAQTRDRLLDLRAILEGRLFTLPGGDVRVAAGYEFFFDGLDRRSTQNTPRGALSSVPYDRYEREVHAVFGEVSLPIFGPENRRPGFYSLVLSAQGRYDHYSDFGGTFNPKLGATYKPVDWFALRGNWSTSFNAPSPIDQLGAMNNTISAFPFVAFPRPGDTVPPGSITVALQGSQPDLLPQEAETWSIGGDISAPPFLPGLRANLSYYNVKFENQLRTPSPNTTIFANFPGNVTTSETGLTPAQLLAFATLAPNGPSVINPLIANGTVVYEFVDFRTGNFGVLRLEGLDFGIAYNHDTSFGGIDFAFNGNHQLKRESQVSPTAPAVDDLEFLTPKWLLKTSLGTNIGDFRAQVSWNHTAGFDVERTNNLPQDRVKAFNTVDLFFKYDFNTDNSLTQDLSVRLNIDNVFDEDPPLYKLINSGSFLNGHGFTVGRKVSLGVSKKF